VVIGKDPAEAATGASRRTTPRRPSATPAKRIRRLVKAIFFLFLTIPPTVIAVRLIMSIMKGGASWLALIAIVPVSIITILLALKAWLDFIGVSAGWEDEEEEILRKKEKLRLECKPYRDMGARYLALSGSSASYYGRSGFFRTAWRALRSCGLKIGSGSAL
jgi:hypothetical protein